MDGQPGAGMGRRDRPDGFLDRPRLLGRPGPDVDSGGGPGGDDVRGRPPLDHAHVDGHARGQVGQGLEPEDQAGQFLDRADALLDLDPGMGGPPLDLEDEVADPGVAT